MGKLNLNAMQEKLDNEAKQSYSNTDYDKLVTGKNVRRILWPKGNAESFYSEGYLHFSLGDDEKKVATCPKTFNSKNKCPICEYVEELQKSKSKDDKKLADDIKAKRRIYVNVINRDSDDEEEKPVVLPIGVTILKGLLETICDADYGDITDPEEGRDVTITRKGQGLKTEYSVLPKPKTSAASESLEPEELEEQMTDLDSLFVEKTYDELVAIMNGEEESSEDDGEDSSEEEDTYDEMDVEELTALCKKRGLKVPAKASRLKLISMLTKYDEALEDEPAEEEETEDSGDDDDSSDSEDDGDDDEVKDAIQAALAKRKGKK